MKNMIKKIIFSIGISLLLLPLVLGIYKIWNESWQYIDWLVMYSFLYWPTYIIAIICIVVGMKRR